MREELLNFIRNIIKLQNEIRVIYAPKIKRNIRNPPGRFELPHKLKRKNVRNLYIYPVHYLPLR